jgi:hypothetical protein
MLGRSGGVAVDRKDNIYLAANFYSQASLGGGYLVSRSQEDLALARFTPDGHHLWSAAFGGRGVDHADGLAVDSAGNVLISGTADNDPGGTDLGGGPLKPIGSLDLIVAKYAADGKHLWSLRKGGSATVLGPGLGAIGVDASDSVLVAGSMYGGEIDFGAAITAREPPSSPGVTVVARSCSRSVLGCGSADGSGPCSGPPPAGGQEEQKMFRARMASVSTCRAGGTAGAIAACGVAFPDPGPRSAAVSRIATAFPSSDAQIAMPRR